MKKAIEFSAFDGATGLYVYAWIFEVIAGSGELSSVSTGQMTELDDGTYAYSFDADAAKSYLGKCRVYTDNQFTDLNTDYPAPSSVVIEPTAVATADPFKKAVEFSAYDGTEDLNVKAFIYRVDDDAFTPVVAGAMDHVGEGTYVYSFSSDPAFEYIARMRVYTDNTFTVLATGDYEAPGSSRVDSTFDGASDTPAPTTITFRDRVNGILSLVGQTSLTDLEYTDLGTTDYSNKPVLYLAMLELIGGRGASDTMINRLKYFFYAIGADINSDKKTAVSITNVFMGAVL